MSLDMWGKYMLHAMNKSLYKQYFKQIKYEIFCYQYSESSS